MSNLDDSMHYFLETDITYVVEVIPSNSDDPRILVGLFNGDKALEKAVSAGEQACKEHNETHYVITDKNDCGRRNITLCVESN